MVTLDFYLPVPGNAQLDVYDLSGKKLKAVINQSFASGWYTINVPTADLQNGVYVCTLIAKGMHKELTMEVQH